MQQTSLFIRFFFLTLLLTGLTANAEAADKSTWPKWSSKLHHDHVLTGRIWSAEQGGIFITASQLHTKLAMHDFILLGETHDNVDHHYLQAWLIEKIARYDRRPAIVWEMIRLDQNEALQNHIKGFKKPASKLGDALGWDKTGWPDWKIYQPIAEKAYAFRLPMKASNAHKVDTQRVRKEGFSALPGDLAKTLSLEDGFGEDLMNSLRTELKESHCNLLPEKSISPMSNLHRLRDAVMADQLLTSGEKTGAILISGHGHIRADRGVPWYIKQRNPDATVASVMFLEVTTQANYPEDIIPKSEEDKPVADFVWFTPRNEREDQCEKLKEFMAKRKQKSEETKNKDNDEAAESKDDKS